MKNKELSPNDFKETKELVKAGNTYPDLFTQATCQKKRHEEIRNEILKAVHEMNIRCGTDTINILIDGVNTYLADHHNYMKTEEVEQDEKQFLHIANFVFSLTELSKEILLLMELQDRLNNNEKEINLTKHNVLL